MKSSQFIIKRKTLISMIFIAMTLLGYISYKNLPVELYPNAELPFLIVQVFGQMEADPSYIENQAIIPLEGAVSTVEGVNEINSFIQSRGGTITATFTKNTNIKYAYLKLQEKIDAVKSSLPGEFIVSVLKIDTEQIANQFMSLQVRGSGGVDRVRNVADEEIVPDLESIDGIANVEVFGGREKSVEIRLNEDVCRAYNVTPYRIQSLIMQNSEMKVFAGQAFSGKKRYFVNVTAEYTDIHSLGDIIVNRKGPVRLSDVADIFFGVKEQTSLSRVNGKEAVTIQLVRDTRVNLIDLSHDTQNVIDGLNKELKNKDVEIVIQTNSAETMEKNINLIIKLAILGGCIAVLVLWVFLRQLKLVLIITLAIPISVFTAFNFFYAFNISLNSLTLVGIALAVGMLLDNSVVVLENIYRMGSKKMDPETAVVKGTSQVLRSVFAATLTTIAVFLPFVFTSNYYISLMGKHIAVSIISTLLVSLAVALLFIPAATHFFLRGDKNKNSSVFKRVLQKNRLIQIYTLFLKSGMRFPARTVIAGLLIFFVSLFILLGTSVNVSRETETTDFNFYLTMNEGSTLETTDLTVKELEKRLEKIEEKEDLISQIYEDEAILTIKLKEDFKKIDKKSIADIKNEIQNRVKDLPSGDVSFEQPTSSERFRRGGGGGGGGGLAMEGAFASMLGIGSQTEKVVIIGRDFTVMRNVADDIKYYLEESSSVQYANLNIADNRPEVHLRFNSFLMGEYDVPLSSVSSALSTFQSEFSSNMTFKQDNEEYDISIKMDTSEDDTDKKMDDLQKLTVSAESGGSYELSEISNIVYSSGMSNINRVNQEKQIEVTYRFLSEINDSKFLLEEARLEVENIVEGLSIPGGVAVDIVHDERDYSEYYFLIGVAFILVFMILAAVFESLFLPFVILFSIPLAAAGSFLALTFTGNSLMNMNVLTGMLILLGIVVNNGIILIDYVNILRRRGYRKSRALLVAGQARVRPILITAITTIVGMTPLALGQAEYVSQIGAPFAITVIGGLLVSTLLTLIFIPTIYFGLETAIAWIRSLSWRLKFAMLTIGLSGLWLVYTKVETLIIQIICYLLLIILIPAIVFFIMVSLKRAGTHLIPEDSSITIHLQNLVKIYDRQARFVREWNKGKQIREHAGLGKVYSGWKDFAEYIWQIPLLSFWIYFTYFHLTSNFWVLIMSVLVYFYLLYMLDPVQSMLRSKTVQTGRKIFIKFDKYIYKFIFWGFPLVNLVIFQLRWSSPAKVIFIGIVWFLALIVYSVSNRLHQKNINIDRITGRFSGLRRRLYRIIQMIPVIGRKKKPFRALNQVSLDIEKGMFGLLGPNGAGKTTLMRIICGILDQSYGKITINGIDINKKREELQGLIGYLPQEFGMYENMTAYEFLQYQAILKNIIDKEKREKRVKEVIRAVHMEDYLNQKIGSFSGGMKQRIGIAQILLHLPRILVVDEPTAGLDPRERIRFRNLLVELSRERIVIFSTHIIEDISSSCSRVAVLNRGELKYLGDPVRMTTMADGHVWQFHAGLEEFEQLSKELIVIHHMRDGNRIRVRCLSEDIPHESAVKIKPTLEDAYLWLLKGNGNIR